MALALPGCSALGGSVSYADLAVGDCVKGNPQIDGAYRRIECSKATPATSETRPADMSWEVVDKAPDNGGAMYLCPHLVRGITDGDWIVCFQPIT